MVLVDNNLTHYVKMEDDFVDLINIIQSILIFNLMIEFKSDSSGEGVEIIFDSNGIDEFISYLQSIRSVNDSMHF